MRAYDWRAMGSVPCGIAVQDAYVEPKGEHAAEFEPEPTEEGWRYFMLRDEGQDIYRYHTRTGKTERTYGTSEFSASSIDWTLSEFEMTFCWTEIYPR